MIDVILGFLIGIGVPAIAYYFIDVRPYRNSEAKRTRDE